MDFLDFLKQNYFDLITIIFLIVTAFITWRKTGKINKETLSMIKSKIYGIKVREDSGQTFSTTKPEYALDKNANELIEVGTIDIDALIQSCADCALDKILEKFGGLPPVEMPAATPSDAVNIMDVKDEFAELDGFFDYAQSLREQYGLPDTMPIKDIFTTLEAKKAALSEQISAFEIEIKNNKEDK